MIKRIACFLIAAAVSCAAGCASKPVYVSESFDPQKIDQIAMLPCMDCRAKPNPKHDFEELSATACANVKKFLEHKGYRVLQSDDVGTVDYYSPMFRLNMMTSAVRDRGSAPGSTWIKQLGPSSNRWVLIPVFSLLSDEFKGIGFSSQATLSIYLFDKEQGTLIFEDIGFGSQEIGILAAPLYNTIAGAHGLTNTTVLQASTNCVGHIPVRKPDKTPKW